MSKTVAPTVWPDCHVRDTAAVSSGQFHRLSGVKKQGIQEGKEDFFLIYQ
jgi:hypothetical protein